MLTSADVLDSLLASDVTEPTAGFGSAVKVLKNHYDKLICNKNLTTYSTQELLHACPRKFQIKKLAAFAGTSDRINSPTFAFGHAVGAGVATYDATQNLRDAIWECFKAWDIDLLESERKSASSSGKSFYEAVWALYAYESFYETSILPDYETVNIEATIAIDFEDGHYYSGHIDEVLRNKYTGRYLVKENKTSGFANINPALYSNSDQALSYSVVIDMLGGTDYEVLYTVYSVPKQEWITFSFVKPVYKKAGWLQDQLLIHKHIEDYQTVNFFPKRGSACFQFMRTCEYYETCDTAVDTKYGVSFDDLPELESINDIDKIEKVDYRTTLSAILAKQKANLNN